jgi:hypothetical protein
MYFNYKKFFITITALLTVIQISSAFAGYYNKQDSGLTISVSGGQVNSTASTTSTTETTFMFFFPYIINQDSHSYSSLHGGAGETHIDWRASFGEKNKWNQFYAGAGLVFGIYGNMRNLDISDVDTAKKTKSKKLPNTTKTAQHYGGELLIGKYWASPLYTQLAFGVGGTSNGYVYSELSLRVGFDLTKRLNVFGQIAAGGENQGYNGVGLPVFGDVHIHAYNRYTTFQMGLQYLI